MTVSEWWRRRSKLCSLLYVCRVQAPQLRLIAQACAINTLEQATYTARIGSLLQSQPVANFWSKRVLAVYTEQLCNNSPTKTHCTACQWFMCAVAQCTSVSACVSEVACSYQGQAFSPGNNSGKADEKLSIESRQLETSKNSEQHTLCKIIRNCNSLTSSGNAACQNGCIEMAISL